MGEKEEHFEIVASPGAAGSHQATPDARSQRQKDWSDSDEDGDELEGQKRVRKKRRVGRKCGGMCYTPPPVPQATPHTHEGRAVLTPEAGVAPRIIYGKVRAATVAPDH